MTDGKDQISRFYLEHLKAKWQEVVSIDCPFCRDRGYEKPGRMIVFLKQDSFFYGYFRCLNRCVPGGFPLWFAHLAAIPFTDVPDYTADLEAVPEQPEYPIDNINDEIHSYCDRIIDPIYSLFKQSCITKATLLEMQIGFNGRYLVYPYFQEDDNCYSARCVYPDKSDDFFWHGHQDFSAEPYNLFNRRDIRHCENGALFVCEGENNLLTLKQLGFPGVAVSHFTGLEKLSARLFDKVKTVFICTVNSQESETAAKNLASRIGYKARIISWEVNVSSRYSLWDLAKDSGKSFGQKMSEMVRKSRAFSPFHSPGLEHDLFVDNLRKEQSEGYLKLSSGFPLLDNALGGIHGINVVGGAPKVGKSTFMIQIATEMALKRIPVLYYDFENGRQKIYQRTLSRLSRLATDQFSVLDDENKRSRFEAANEKLKNLLFFMRVINDRKVTPEIMRKHIDFIRHETRNEYTVVVIDSLHKLPFNEFSEQRTGIDAWLRQLESIRDELHVSFLVISELSRGAMGSYKDTPHLGVFKGSGDIEYSADNAMVLFPDQSQDDEVDLTTDSGNSLWLVASREHSPGRVADYQLDYPFWGFTEHSI